MTKPETYRLVFQSPQGREVLADLAAYAERVNEKPGSAGQLITHITKVLNVPDAPAMKIGLGRIRKASGGRIQHG